MKVLCILLCVAFTSGFYIDNNGTHEEKIIGGRRVRIEDLPYMASLLLFRLENICGATIIHRSWVITTAHCVKNRPHIAVRTGSELRTSLLRVHTVERVIPHDDFETNGKNNDIALIKLEQPIQFNNKQELINIAKPHDIPEAGELMRISGFGQLGPHLRKSDVLMAAYVPVVDQADCIRAIRANGGSDPITDDMFCAGDGNADMCHGDSGGPGVIHGKFYGIMATAAKCGSRRSTTVVPGVYTRVHKFYDWIVEKTGHTF